MIAYLEKYGTTVDVPDDASRDEIKDINDNFHNYVDTTPKTSEPAQPTSNSAAQPQAPESPQPAPKWQPNLYGAVLSQMPTPFPQINAYAGKEIEGATFGAAKPLLDPLLGQTFKDHPAFADAGAITGGVGSLMEAGGALRIAGLAAPAGAAGSAAVDAGFAAGERFIPRAIMTGATFGTRTFIAETAKAFQQGGVNLEQFGKDVLKNTAFGGIFGSIGGLESITASVSSAGALGFISSKMSGSDNREASLNAAIWGAFEAVGSAGKSENLRMEALGHLKDSMAEYAQARNPDLDDKTASHVAGSFIDNAMKKAGFDSAEDIAKSGPANLLEGIEKVNQMVRTARVPAEPEAQTPLLPKLPAPIEPETAVAPQTTAPAPQTPLEKAISTVKGMMGIKPEEPKPPTVTGDTYEEKIQSLQDQGHDVSKMPIEAFPEDMKDFYHFEQGKTQKADMEKGLGEIAERFQAIGISPGEGKAIFDSYGLDKKGPLGQPGAISEIINKPIEDQYVQAYQAIAAQRGIDKGEKFDAETMDQAQKVVDLVNGYFSPKSQEIKEFVAQHPKASDHDIAQMAHDRGLLESPNPDLLKAEMQKANQEYIPEIVSKKEIPMHLRNGSDDWKPTTFEAMVKDKPGMLYQDPVGIAATITAINGEKVTPEQIRAKQIQMKKSRINSETGSVMIPPDLVDVVNHIHKSSEEISNIVAPAKAAPLAAQITREHLGKMARAYDIAEAALKDAHDVLEKRSKEENINFIDNLERGNPQRSENLQVIADKLRTLLDAKRKEIQNLGTGKLDNFIENYFPHIWDQGEKEVGQIVQKAAKRPLEGQKSFLKKRTFEFTKEGIQAGLTPVSYNPVDLALLKMREMDKYIMAHATLNEFKDEGLSKFVRVGGEIPEGWEKIDDRISTVMFKSEAGLTISGHIYAQPDAARIINNYLSPGLQKSAIYQAYRYAGNLINQFQLSLSAFHLGFVSLEGSISKLALGINEMALGHPINAIKNVLEAPFAPLSTLIRGDEMLKAWRGQGNNSSDNVLAEAMAVGGGRARMDQFYATKASDQMRHYFETGRVFKGIFTAPFAALEISTKPILEYYVPRMKLGAFSDIMKMEMQNNPNMTHQEMRELAQKAWDSIDNRFGQLVYDNLFWNRTFKDLTMASMRSVGWNLGTIREIGGAGVDALKQPLRGKDAEVTYKMAHFIALTTLIGALGAMIQYLRTGKGPQEAKDYYYPKTGGIDEHGDPHRIALPSYMKDLYHYKEAPVTTVLNKLNPILSMMAEMFENKDYYGTKIRNEDDPLMKQIMAEAGFIAKQAVPFSIRNMQKNQQAGNKSLFDTVGPWVGITPAPYDIDQTKAEKLAHEIAMSHQEIGGRTEEQMERSRLVSDLTRQYKMGDPKATDNIYKAYQAGAISHYQVKEIFVNSSLSPLQRSVKNMTLEEAERVYAKSNDEEKGQIESMVERKRANRERQFAPQ